MLLEPAPPYLRCCVFQNGAASVHTVKLQGDWAKTIGRHLGPDADLEAIGYVLHNGGSRIRGAVSLLSCRSLRTIRQCVQLLPEYNSMTLDLAEYWMSQRREARHLLLCDTAFFTQLSPVVRNYAIPYELTRKGLGRHCAFGLCHEWVWKQTRAQSSKATKNVISIFLGNHTSLAAIHNGIPKETTSGLAAVEGILSSSGCGDIDPTVIFLLKAAGFSYSAINRIVCNESGFAALAGRPCTLSDIVSGPSTPELATANRLLRYQIIKQIGAMISVLGGVDTLAFATERPHDTVAFILGICEALAFLGVRCRADTRRGGFPRKLSTADSTVRVLVHRYDRWAVMNAAMESF